MLLDAGEDADDEQDDDDDHGPELEAEGGDHEIGLGGGKDGGGVEQEQAVAAGAVVLPDAASVGVAAVEGGSGPHGEADEDLEQLPDGRDDAQVGVHGVEVREPALHLVGLDGADADDEAHQRRRV